jgi:AcrR family transcriptional regulator
MVTLVCRRALKGRGVPGTDEPLRTVMTDEKLTKREQIRKAAYVAFREQGYFKTSVDTICKAAGVSKGSYYWHFDSKQEVFIDILDAWTREVTDEMFEQFQAAGKSEDYVSAIALALQREAHRGRAIVPLWFEFTALALREPQINAALARFYRRIRSAVTELLRPILGDKIPEDELRAVAATAFAAYYGLIIQDLADPGAADATCAVERFMGAIGLWDDATRIARELR